MNVLKAIYSQNYYIQIYNHNDSFVVSQQFNETMMVTWLYV